MLKKLGIKFEYKFFCQECDSEHFSVAAVQLPTVDILKPDPMNQKPIMTTSPPEARRVRFKRQEMAIDTRGPGLKAH